MKKFYKINEELGGMSYLEYLKQEAASGHHSAFKNAIKQVTLSHLLVFHQEDIGISFKKLIHDEMDRREKRLIYLENHHSEVYKIEH